MFCFRNVSVGLTVLWLGFLVGNPLPASPPKNLQVEFSRDIQPLLEERCLSCHGPEMQESGFRVDRRDVLVAGGDSEQAAIVPGNSKAGVLIERVTTTDLDLRMPPEGKSLTKADIAKIKAWIQNGAQMPDQFEERKRTESDHWSFQPVTNPAVPRTQSPWIQNPIDAFVLQRLEQADLSPANAAARETLIRRVTFDLAGLPPTPEEIAEFVSDSSPNAYEKLVDRLLASPAYGERWGRHWLDVARYADSNGLDENVAHGNAWRYRDYVISALNSDLSYANFVREQLAGDLLPAKSPAEKNRQFVATGFLSLGPKVLAEVDETKMEMDIVDEQIDTFGKAFLGLTLGCARCHDHKFDPLTTEDYYALAGIFKSTKTMDSFTKIAKWHEEEIPNQEQREQKRVFDEKVQAQQRKIDDLVKAANAALLARLADNPKLPAEPEKQYPEETREKLKTLREELEKLHASAPEMPTAMGVSEGTVTDVAVHRRGSHLTLGKIVPRRFPAALSKPNRNEISGKTSGRLELAHWLTKTDHPLTARVIVNRVWRWHFGRGLVDSTDNLGELGSAPSHPELLDWLSNRLVESNWSLKSLHRLIVTSSTYRQSAKAKPEIASKARLVDPENRLLWRANVRRLEAEAIRDSLLAVSGQLDRRMGGSILNTENRKHVFDHTSKDQTSYDTAARSVYLPIVRNHLYDMFQLFDYTDASTVNGNRATSTVAPQALYLLNAEFVEKSARQLAQRLRQSEESEAERIRSLYQTALGRTPTETETNRAQEALARFQKAAGNEAWSLLCHAVLMSNEFVTIR